MQMILDALDEMAGIFSEKKAFVDDKRCINFLDLKQEIYRVASILIAKGYQRRPIAVFMDKSIECIASFMGSACSGNFYTPVDVKMPNARIEKIMQTLCPAAIITDSYHKARVSEFATCGEILVYDEMMDEEADFEAVVKVSQSIIDTDTLYVIFTSGSTGSPKGVMISHRAMTDYVGWTAKQFKIDEKSILGNQSPLYFDLSIQDIYAPFLTGCTVVLIPEQKFLRPKQLFRELLENKVNTIFWVPSALCLLADFKVLQMKDLPHFQKILFCGEILPVKYLNQWRHAFPDAQFVNLYGPTEACDACAYYVVDREFSMDETLPIGKARKNVNIFLLDEQDRLIEDVHVMGEICIRGTALSNGYYRAPEKTKSSFVQNPLNDYFREIVYRTGDLGEYNDLGELMYISRKDWQIKHMGHRIELGEIESAAMSLDGIQQAACIYDSSKKRIILAYSGANQDKEVIIKLKELVPTYMLPEVIRKFDQLPQNRNGKTDRRELMEMMGID